MNSYSAGAQVPHILTSSSDKDKLQHLTRESQQDVIHDCTVLSVACSADIDFVAVATVTLRFWWWLFDAGSVVGTTTHVDASIRVFDVGL